jgi:hypothetical protein
LSGAAGEGDAPPRRFSAVASVAVVASLVGVFWAGYAWVKTTNFGSYDEWLAIWLNARGMTSIPYANRPLVFFWSQPARLLGNSLRGYWLLHGLYLSAVGPVTLALSRRLVPSAPTVGFLAAVFAVAWAPLDSSRLDAVALLGYSGNVLSTYLAILVYYESARRSSVPLLTAAWLLGLVSARAGEVVLPILGAAPLGLLALDRTPRRWPAWVGAWLAMVLAAGAFTAQAVLFPSAGSYQASALGFDPNPLHVAARLFRLFSFHLLPLVQGFETDGARVAIVIALLAFALGFVAVRRGGPEPKLGARRLGLVMLGGALAALLTYLPYALSPAVTSPLRTQMTSAVGIGFLLAGIAYAAAAPLPERWRPAALFLLGGWVIAAGTGRTLLMQREWDVVTRWPVQSGSLRDLTRLAPDLRPNTFVLLFDETETWPATFTFRHAVDYLYDAHAVGAVWGALPFLYPFRFAPEGLVAEPWPVIRRPWGMKPTLHAWNELVVARLSPSGLEIMERWPDGVLPPLPPGAAYEPEGRIVRGGAPIRAQAVLAER